MKYTIFIIALFFAVQHISAQEYTLKGEIPEGTQTIFLQKIHDHKYEAATLNDSGLFSFKGKTPSDALAVVADKDKRTFLPVVLEGNLTVDFKKKSVTGSEENEKLSQWNASFDSLRTAILQTKESIKNARKDDKKKEAAKERLSELNDAYLSKILHCCHENNDKKFPAFFLSQYYPLLPKSDIIALAKRQPAYLNIPLMAPLKKAVKGWSKQAAGLPFTDFTMPDQLGISRKLSDFTGKGKYVLVDFWASWCGPCCEEMPEMKLLYDKYHQKGFDIVGVSFDNKKEAWTQAIQKMGLNWNHISELNGWKNSAAAIYGISSIPSTLLIGPDGKIVASGIRAHDLKKKLAEIYPD